MSAPQTLVQAALNRLTARLGSGLLDAAAGLAVLAQDAPERLRREWELFREEVEQEAERLENPAAAASHDAGVAAGAGLGAESQATSPASAADAVPMGDPQRQVDALRARVARLARLIEDQG